VLVDINQRPLPVPRYVLEVVSTPPKEWTIVEAPRQTGRVPRAHQPHYAVCPSCRERAPIRTKMNAMRCPRCKQQFDIAWNEDYLATY
jgi:hypothetical protein